MTTVTIQLPDERATKLEDKAKQLHVTLEDLVLASVEDLLARSDEEFKCAVEYVLRKNAELYQRLA